MKRILEKWLTSKKTKARFDEVRESVDAAKLEREWVQNVISPMVNEKVEETHRILERNHFAEKLSKTFVRRPTNGGFIG